MAGHGHGAQVVEGKTRTVHVFQQPERKIKNEDGMEKWTKSQVCICNNLASNLSLPSQAYAELMGFIQIVSEAVAGKKVTDDFALSPVSL